MKPVGIAITAALLLAPMIWLPGIAAGRDVVALFSQYLGLAALIAMAVSHVIATRWRGVEAVFGPLDQAYRLHKWLGIGSMVAILLHDTIDAEMRGLGRETLLVEAAETAGEISLYGLLILVVITIATFIPYHLWKWTHRLIGIFFVMGAFHYLFILKPFSNGGPLGLYMAAVCVIGVVAYGYTSAPRGMRPATRYRISALTPQGQAVAVDMTPDARPLRHRAGQFAFFGFPDAGLSEPHPFTLSDAPRADGSLRITIAPLGDYTIRVSEALKVGQSVRVDGAFGHFGYHGKGPQIWIAAGIGVTPFVAMAAALSAQGDPVEMIFAVRSRADAPHLDALETLAAQNPRLSLHVWQSGSSGRLTARDVADVVSSDLSQATVSFCGPVAMRRALSDGLAQHGVSARRMRYEAFEIRTGLGLRRLGAKLWPNVFGPLQSRV